MQKQYSRGSSYRENPIPPVMAQSQVGVYDEPGQPEVGYDYEDNHPREKHTPKSPKSKHLQKPRHNAKENPRPGQHGSPSPPKGSPKYGRPVAYAKADRPTDQTQKAMAPGQSQETTNQVEHIKMNKNIFYDNLSKSNSPVKKHNPKTMTHNPRQLSFRNMKPVSTGQVKRKQVKQSKKSAVISNQPRSLMHLNSGEEKVKQVIGTRPAKNGVKEAKPKRGIPGSEVRRPIKKKNSRVSKKRSIRNEPYRQIPTKRRNKKSSNAEQQSHPVKSLKSTAKMPKNMFERKKQSMPVDSRMSGLSSSPRKQIDDKTFNNYSSKAPRTSNALVETYKLGF